jgi:dephospho-CoA kinase
MKRVIGLTGAMGSGKSTVSAYLREKGVRVIDADEISRDLTRTGQPDYEAIVREFGREFLSDDGGLDRRALGKSVFADPGSLMRLEGILHPLIIRRMKDELERAEGTVVIDAPLLYKAGLDALCGEVWVVCALPETRIERILARDGITEEEARARLGSQLSPGEMEEKADVVLKNGGSLEDLHKQIDEVLYG